MRNYLFVISLFIFVHHNSFSMISGIGEIKSWKLVPCAYHKSHMFLSGITQGNFEISITVSETNPNDFVGAIWYPPLFLLTSELTAELVEKSGFKQALLDSHKKDSR